MIHLVLVSSDDTIEIVREMSVQCMMHWLPSRWQHSSWVVPSLDCNWLQYIWTKSSLQIVSIDGYISSLSSQWQENSLISSPTCWTLTFWLLCLNKVLPLPTSTIIFLTKIVWTSCETLYLFLYAWFIYFKLFPLLVFSALPKTRLCEC